MEIRPSQAQPQCFTIPVPPHRGVASVHDGNPRGDEKGHPPAEPLPAGPIAREAGTGHDYGERRYRCWRGGILLTVSDLRTTADRHVFHYL